MELSGRPQVLWPVHCVQNSEGAKLAEGLDVERITRVFPKGERPDVDSYSGFFDNGGEFSTGMAEWLRDQGVTELLVCGLATDYCVKFTVLDAVKSGFEVSLALSACRGVNLNPEDVEKAVEEMRQSGVVILELDDQEDLLGFAP